MKLNKEKLDQWVEAVMNATHSPEQLEDKYEFNYQVLNTRLRIRTALTPFAMEMTDEKIMNEAEKRSSNSLLQSGFMMGANFVKYGK